MKETGPRKDFQNSGEIKDIQPITNIEDFRNTMREFWHKDVSVEKFRDRLEQEDSEYAQWLISQKYEQSASLMATRKKPENRKSFKFTDLIIASSNPEKKKFITEIAETQNSKIKDTLIDDSVNDEEKTHTALRELIKEKKDHNEKGVPIEPTFTYYCSALYALDVARRKAENIRRKHSESPVIACDIVVLDGEDILEKPKNKEGAIEMLKKISGKTITISFGAVILTPANSLGRIALQEAGNILIDIKKLTDQEIDNYLADSEDNYLNIAGAIDYSNPAAASLIEGDSPVSIQRIDDLEVGASANTRSFSQALLPQIKDYLIGTPKELIRELLREGKIVSV